ncbi:MAG: IscS subfamily cysteine desulfurase [Acidobacteriota bacterium]|nr:IscS subfamily cysteine desulfurase [Acidobacteriota bacterium]
MKLPIYLDHHATTPVDRRVLERMLPYFTEDFGNAASRSHSLGWRAEEAVEWARSQVADLIGASPKEIIFTSGATEANNLALLGAAEMYREKGDHIITQVTEHKAVLDTAKRLQQLGYRLTFLPVDPHGRVDPDDLRKALDRRTLLVSIMFANNEVGTLQPIADLARTAREQGALFHSDAAQAPALVPIDVEAMGIDLLSLSAHKAYGPKGIGALYVRRKNPRVRLAPQMFGGGHERGMRSGTLPVPGLVGFGTACEIAAAERDTDARRLHDLARRLHDGIRDRLDEVYLNGHPTERLPNNLNLSFAYVEGEALMMGMTDIAVSSGSACSSASLEPSYVLKALGVGDDLAHTSIRFGLGRSTTREEIDYAAGRVTEIVLRLRELSPLYEMAKQGMDLKKISWKSG